MKIVCNEDSIAMIALYDIACVDEETARDAVTTTCDCLLDRFLPREEP